MKKENDIKRIGLWLDQTEAHFIHPTVTTNEPENTASELASQVRHKGESADGVRLGGFRSTNNENHKQHREQDALHKYYKELQHKLLEYDEIYIFGPGPARSELYNLMKEDAHFSAKNIHSESADHMSENQLHAKVKAYFNK